MNPKKMKQMMNKLGMKMDPIEGVTRVIIESEGGNYIFDEAEVVVMSVQGTVTYQLTGEPRFEAPKVADSEPLDVEITDDDVQLVAMQTGVSEDAARSALLEANGDIAEAIMKLGSE